MRRLNLLLCMVLLLLPGLIQAQGSQDLQPELPYVPPKRWAMVVGAGDYTQFGKLSYTVKDAESFAQLLIDRYQFQPNAVELITDSPKSLQKPDAATIKAALARQIADKRLDKGDLFIFYFSGHGIGTPEGDLLLPTDATTETAAEKGQPVKEIVDMFVKAGLRNVLIIADACRAGEKNSFGRELRELGRQANIAVILGCAPGARSYEYPQLGHGAFTNFLLKALKDKELCSPVSGALWASKVAEDVEKKVYEYTERDYHQNAQRPTAWTEKTEDVLLGSFVSRTNLAKATESFTREAKKLDPKNFAASIDLYAATLSSESAYGQAVELYKTLDGLGQLSSMSRYNFGHCLVGLGRHREAEREFDRLANQDDDPLAKYISIVYNPSHKVTPMQRVVAAKAAWKLEPTAPVGTLVWGSLAIYASTSDSQEFLAGLLAAKVLSPRSQRYYEGKYAAYGDDWLVALRAYDEALKMDGQDPKDADILVSRYSALQQLDRKDDVVACLKQISRDEDHAANAILALARIYKEGKDQDRMVAAVKEALKHKMTPDDMLTALRVIGMRVDEIVDLLGSKASEFPYSWQAAVAKSWSNGYGLAGGIDTKALAEARKYTDNDFEVVYEYLRIRDIQLGEMHGIGLLKEADYLQQQSNFTAVMVDDIDQLGFDVGAWSFLTKLALASEKLDQLFELFESQLSKPLEDGTLHPRLRVPYLEAAINVGNFRRMEQIWTLGGLTGDDAVDAAWYRALALAMEDRFSEARKAIPSKRPSGPLDIRAKALVAYLDVVEEKPIDLAGVRQVVDSDPVASKLIALAYVKRGDWARAEPMLLNNLWTRVPGYNYVHAKASQTIFERLVATKRFKEADSFAYNTMTFAFGNPLYSKIHFGPVADVAPYAGTTKLDGAAFRLVTKLQSAGLQFSVTKEGAVTVSGKIAAAPLIGSGAVDAYGNLRATVKSGDKTWTMAGKIAPSAFYKTMPEFGQLGQGFLLIEPGGQSLYIFGKPVQS